MHADKCKIFVIFINFAPRQNYPLAEKGGGVQKSFFADLPRQTLYKQKKSRYNRDITEKIRQRRRTRLFCVRRTENSRFTVQGRGRHGRDITFQPAGRKKKVALHGFAVRYPPRQMMVCFLVVYKSRVVQKGGRAFFIAEPFKSSDESVKKSTEAHYVQESGSVHEFCGTGKGNGGVLERKPHL